jgi:amino acid transporter/predicted transcriptional regulator
MEMADQIKEDSQPADLKRSLGLRDVFFLSFGGMSPLLSLLTYGAVALEYGGPLAPLIMIIGMLLVLVNGLVVMQLSKRFRTTGGYYTYAFQALTERVGLSTGWMYLFYSSLYAMAYLVGAVFIVNTLFGISSYLIFFVIIIPAITFLILGVRPSSKYAVYTGIIEILVIVVIFVFSILLAGGSTYIPNPITMHISSGFLALGILFAMSIPTGYGSIAPISGEIKDPEKTVGRAAVSVIMVGGTLATIFLYGIYNLLLHLGISTSSSGGLPILGILENHFSVYSYYIIIVVAIASINDGILALLSFGSAASRTIFRMGVDRSFPAFFAKKIRDQPIAGNITVSLILFFIPLIMITRFPNETAFIILGTIASLGGLFIHIIADFSLIRIGLRRSKRMLLRGAKGLWSRTKDYKEVILAIAASIITSIELIYAAYSTVLVYSTLFLIWIVLGYIIVDIKDIVTKTPYTTKLGKEDRMIAERIKDLTSLKVQRALPDVVVSLDDTLQHAIQKCVNLDSQGAAVVDKYNNPVRTFVLRDVFLLSEQEIAKTRVRDIWLEQVVTIDRNTGVSDMIKLFKEYRVPVLCIIDENGKLAGTVREREVLMALGSSDSEKLGPKQKPLFQ